MGTIEIRRFDEPDETVTFVSDTTHALVAGSGMAFDDRGLHELKGFSEPRHLYAAIGSPS